MPELKLSWLGPPFIELRGRPIKFEMRKVTALVAYLSLHMGEISREKIATMFWPENDQQHALGSLRRTLSSLSNSLDSISLDIDRETVGLKDRDYIQVDVDDFRQRIEKVNLHHPPEHTPGEEPLVCSDCMTVLEEAVGLYRGDFLEGFNLKDCPEFDDWQFFQRENLRSQLASALEMLVMGYEGRRTWDKALLHSRRWVSLDRLNEPAQRMLIRLYIHSGQRSTAVRQVEILIQLLKDELGQAPEAETLSLYQSLAPAEGSSNVRNESTFPISSPQKPEPLIKTKLFIPPLRVDRVARPRLLELLNAGSQRALTLVSAPAGFGKTTLLTSWVSHTHLPIAWLSIDEGDNDPVRFVSYLAAALESALPDIEGKFQGKFLTLQPSIQPAMTGLVNQLAAVIDPFVLVLDDYQFIHSAVVHKAVEFLLEKIPAAMHLVIATRTDPPLPLARLRARDQLVELRAADLRFTQGEAAGFLKQAMRLDLSIEDVSALETRTEGWAAGLQMAALAIRNLTKSHPTPQGLRSANRQSEIARFIHAFTGSHRFILDYLGEEVLSHRTEGIRLFLLQTAILERLSGPLCDAVTQGQGSQAMLETLEKENLFLIPLDHERRWYRYHHLFGELLRYKLEEMMARSSELDKQDQPTLEDLHLHAAQWFEDQNLPDEAIRHALA
ncbi:MAG: hypothetical protein EHM70_19485, partial [Chloroflexota bacterium]